MKRRLLIVGVVLGVLCIGMATAWHVHDNTLSSGLKRTLFAATDPNCSESDLRFYIREARLQTHTRKDRAVLAELENAVDLAADAERQESSYWKQWEKTMTDLLGPANVSDAEWARQRQQYKADAAAEDATLKLSQDEAAAAKKSFNAFRVDLGLKPIGD